MRAAASTAGLDAVPVGTQRIAETCDGTVRDPLGRFIGCTGKAWNRRLPDNFRGAAGSLGRRAHRLLGRPQAHGHKGREVDQRVD